MALPIRSPLHPKMQKGIHFRQPIFVDDFTNHLLKIVQLYGKIASVMVGENGLPKGILFGNFSILWDISQIFRFSISSCHDDTAFFK